MALAEQVDDVRWKVHTTNLLEEVLNNKGASILAIPLKVLGEKLAEIAELAIEIDDPRLHLLMMDLTLYSASDPAETPLDEIAEIRTALIEQINQRANQG